MARRYRVYLTAPKAVLLAASMVFVRSFSTTFKAALRAAACGGRPRPAAPRLLLGKNLGGWRGLVRTAIAGTTVTVGLRLLSLLLLPRWLNSTSWLRTRYLVGRVPRMPPC
jgi:hypothetical protein